MATDEYFHHRRPGALSREASRSGPFSLSAERDERTSKVSRVPLGINARGLELLVG